MLSYYQKINMEKITYTELPKEQEAAHLIEQIELLEEWLKAFPWHADAHKVAAELDNLRYQHKRLDLCFWYEIRRGKGLKPTIQL